MKKSFYLKLFLNVFLVLTILFSACNVGENNKYTNEYIKLTSINEQVENYKFNFTVENISNEDITVVVRVYLKTGGVIDSGTKKILKGDSYTFNCTSEAGKFFENPKGIIVIYNSNGASVSNMSFEFDI